MVDSFTSTTLYEDGSGLSSVPQLEKQEQLRKIITDTYREVEEGFFAWEQETSREAIALLQCDSTGLLEDDIQRAVDPDRSTLARQKRSVDDWSLVTYYHRGGATHRVQASSPAFETPYYEQLPPYESCTPSTRSFGTLPNRTLYSDTLPFIPYLNCQDFDWEDFVDLYEEFAWIHNADRDPDGKHNSDSIRHVSFIIIA